MSDEYVYTPPPPPPPPTQAPASGYDFVKPFAFVFEDARWLNKVLIGGCFQLASVILIGIPFLIGYLARLVRNVINGVPNPLPEWDDMGRDFAEGLRFIGIGLIYMLPGVAILCMILVPLVAIGALSGNHSIDPDHAEGLVGIFWCLTLPLGLIYLIWIPAAFLMAAVEERFGAAFEFGRIWRFLRNNAGNYVLAILVAIVARFASGFGIILFCIGIFFTVFWAMVVSFYAFAQVWKVSPVKP